MLMGVVQSRRLDISEVSKNGFQFVAVVEEPTEPLSASHRWSLPLELELPSHCWKLPLWWEGCIHGLENLDSERMETCPTHFWPLDDKKYDCRNGDVANVGTLTFEVSSVVPTQEDVVADDTLMARNDVDVEVVVDVDTSHLETTSGTLQVLIMDILQAELSAELYVQVLPTGQTIVLVYQGTYRAVPVKPVGSFLDSSRDHDENGDDTDHRD